MAAIATERAPAPVAAARRPRRSPPVWRWAVLLIAGVYFLLPLYAALRFAGLSAFGTVFKQPGFGAALWLSPGWPQ
jgi:putative spermidine/putrescine transport system permease protein